MSDRDYIMSVESKVKTGYGRGFTDASDEFEDYVYKYIKDIPFRNRVLEIHDKSMDNYYERCGNGNDAKLRVLPRSRDYIDGVIKGEV